LLAQMTEALVLCLVFAAEESGGLHSWIQSNHLNNNINIVSTRYKSQRVER